MFEFIPEDILLKLKISDLPLNIKKSYVYPYILQVIEELKNHKINFKMNMWFADEWFVADDTVGMGVPFYMLDLKLIKMEKKHVGFVDGETKQECLNIIRHEIGHVLDNAFKIRQREDFKKIFGDAAKKYPKSYDYKKYSKKFVRNIKDGYAQGHPVEDFAETFAVWLDPNSCWKSKYKLWPAYKKLLYVDKLIKGFKNKKQVVFKKESFDLAADSKITLKKYYSIKKRLYGQNGDDFWDSSLKKVFSGSKIKSPTAYEFLTENRVEIINRLHCHENIRKYRLKKIYTQLRDRSKRLNLKVGSNTVATTKKMGYHFNGLIKVYYDQGRHLTLL